MMTDYNCNVYMLVSSELEITITKFHFFYTFQIAKCIAGAVCCCVFYKNYIAMFAITIFGVVIEKHLDWLLCECVTCPSMSVHRNVWPEAVYCCFTRTTLFTELLTCLYDQS